MDDEARSAFESLHRRLDRIDAKLAEHDARFTAHDGRFVQIDGRFAQIDERFDALDRKIDAQGVMLRTEILVVGQMVAHNTESIALLRRDVDELR